MACSTRSRCHPTIAAKISGAAFVHDLDLPGMLHGRVARPPSYRARLLSLDAEPVRAMPGVEAVVREGCFLGVVAQREEQAIQAMQALAKRAQWNRTVKRVCADDSVQSRTRK